MCYHVTLEFIVILIFFIICCWVLDECCFYFFPHAENLNLNWGSIMCKSHEEPVEGNIMLF